MVEPLLSIVSPVYCEESCIGEFHARTKAAVEQITPPVRAEFIYVDDGSTDRSEAILRKIAESDPAVRVIRFSRNFGHQLAITAGVDSAHGDAVVVIDADLQDPPEVIPEFVREWRAGNEVVYGVRRARTGESQFKLRTARLFYRMLNRLSDTELPLDSGDFRLLDRQVVQELRQLREQNRYVRGLVAWVGFTQCAVEYDRAGRHSGESKYTLRKMVQLAIDAVTSFSEKPLRLALKLGIAATSMAVLLAGWFILGKILAPKSALPGFASLIAVVLLLGGLQLLCLGLIGEYVARTYLETKQRPLYIVRERLNFPPHPELEILIDVTHEDTPASSRVGDTAGDG
jgi:polyisoprenyl-phosphate glycosyltransferase